MFTEFIKKSGHLRTPILLDELIMKLRGHYNNFGVVGSMSSIIMVYDLVVEVQNKWLNRRSGEKV